MALQGSRSPGEVLSFPPKRGHGSGRHGSTARQWGRAPPIHFFVCIGVSGSLTRELQTAKVSHTDSEHTVPCWRKANEREWGEIKSSLTRKSGGTMWGKGLTQKTQSV